LSCELTVHLIAIHEIEFRQSDVLFVMALTSLDRDTGTALCLIDSWFSTILPCHIERDIHKSLCYVLILISSPGTNQNRRYGTVCH
jgi:hypothetical protein